MVYAGRDMYPRYRLTVGGRDLTTRLVGFDLRYGSLRPPYAFGHVADPSVALIDLNNQDDALNPFTTALVDVKPGALVKLEAQLLDQRVITLYEGWSRGLVGGHVVGTPYEVQIPVEGALSRISQYHSRLYVPVFDNLLPGELLNAILTTALWPLTRRRIDLGSIRIHELRGQAQFSGGRQWRDTLSRLDLIAQAEGGYVYDDHLGRVVFEDYGRLRTSGIVRRLTEDSFRALPALDSVVNWVEGEGQEADVGTLDPQNLQNNFPIVVPVNPGQKVRVRLAVDSSEISFIQRVEPLVLGKHYTFPGAHTLEPPALEVVDSPQGYVPGAVLTLTNDGTTTQDWTIIDVEGFAGSIFAPISPWLIIPRERVDSVRQYGLRQVTYPAGKMFANPQNASRRITDLLDTYDGIVRPPVRRMEIHGSGTYYQEWLEARIGEDAVFTEVPGFWRIREVHHQWRMRQPHRVSLTCAESLATPNVGD